MKKIFKYGLLILFFSLTILFFYQSLVRAVELKSIDSMEELRKAFEEKAIIEGNKIKLTDNVILINNTLDVKIPELIIDFNGKTIECKEYGNIYVRNKVTFEDSSTTNKSNWGGIIFSSRSARVEVEEDSELIINNGKFVDSVVNNYPSDILNVMGKLTINDATFSTTRTEPKPNYSHAMIILKENSDTVINNGNFSNCDKIIAVSANDPYKNNCKLTINGGSFKSTGQGSGTIYITSLYPYVNENNEKEIITPKVVLNNCNVEGDQVALEFLGGSTDEEFKNANTKIITILGGTYKCTKERAGFAALLISTKLSPFTYFNPKDIVIQNGTFESEDARRGNTFRRSNETVNIQRFVIIS